MGLSALLFWCVLIALALVVFVLFAGVLTMLKQKNAHRSQILMRWRVSLQLVALILIFILFYLKA